MSAARVFTGLTLVSRVFGLLRDSAFAAVFGRRTVAADCFSIGFTIPNLFRRLFGEGALTSALIPVLTDYEVSPDPAQRELGLRLIQAVVTLATMLLAAITVLAEVALLVFWLGWGGDLRTRLMIGLAAVMFPYVILVCLVGALSAILNVRGRFAEGAAAPIVLNLCQILAAAVVVPLIPAPDHVRIFAMAGAVLVGGVLQLLMILRALRVRGIGLKARLDWSHPGVRRVTLMMAPMIAPLAVVQINTLVDKLIAWLLIAHGGNTAYRLFGWVIPRFLDTGSVITLDYAAHLYEMPLGVFSVALATAIFPALSRHGSAGDRAGLADTLRRGLEIALLIAIPATVGLILLRDELVRTILQYGNFKASDTPAVAVTMAFYALGLAAFSSQQLLIRAFYALKQVRTPVWIAVGMVALNLPLNLVLVFAMRSIAGLALSTTICACIQSVWLGVVLRKRLGRMGGRSILRSLVQTLAATALMAGAILLWQHASPRVFGSDPAHMAVAARIALRAARLLIPVVLGAGVFLAVTWALRNKALRELLSPER